MFLPIRILCPIQSPSLTLRVHIKNVLPTPALGVGIVLHRAQTPIRAARHRVNGNLAKILVLPFGSPLNRHPINQTSEGRGDSRNVSTLMGILPWSESHLVPVNRLTHHAQVLVQSLSRARG